MRRIFIERQGVNPELLIFEAINLLNNKVKVRIAHPKGMGGLLWVADSDLERAQTILSAAAITSAAIEDLHKRN